MMHPKYLCQACKCIMLMPIECHKCRAQCCVECSPALCTQKTECDHYFSQVDQEKKKEVMAMYVKCKYNLQGCLKLSRMIDLDLHERQCEFTKMACDKAQCIETQKATKSASHMADCPYAIIVCPHCDK